MNNLETIVDAGWKFDELVNKKLDLECLLETILGIVGFF